MIVYNAKLDITEMIHGIGPRVVNTASPSEEEQYRLQSAYKQVFRVAIEANLTKLVRLHCFKLATDIEITFKIDFLKVIPFIATGRFGFHLKTGMRIALLAALEMAPDAVGIHIAQLFCMLNFSGHRSNNLRSQQTCCCARFFGNNWRK